MDKLMNTDMLFSEYYEEWIRVYKSGAIRDVTLRKYEMTAKWIRILAPELKVSEINRSIYQELINSYAQKHERQTTMDFHHQLKAAVMDAVDEQLILTLDDAITWDWFILLIAKTGLRFSEALAITPKDFDFKRQLLSIDKTWDYKGDGGFLPTKNKSSIRKIRLDWQTIIQFFGLIREMNPDEPIFLGNGKKVYNSTVNNVLRRHCISAEIPVITAHGLRHTHASLLLFDGVSTGSVAQRLGHSSMTTTQKVYLHVIKELENKDVDAIMRSLSSLVD